jgi:signal transduction histidine kinase
MASSLVSARTFHEPRLWPLAGREYWIAIPVVALAYAGVATISLLLAIPPGYASAVWPPAGIALAAWLAFGSRIWPGILIGAAIANLGVIGTSPAVAMAIGAGNAAEAAVAGFLVQQFVGLRHRFETPAAVWRFAAIAFGAAMLAATNGVTTLSLAGQVPWDEFHTHWITWWLGDATGIIIVTPLLLCWSDAGNGRSAGEKRIEYQFFGALLLLAGALAWSVRFPADMVQKIAYLAIPLVTWAAARLDQRAVTASSFAISAVAILDMLDGNASMFAPLALSDSLLLLQLFVSAVALTGLTLSALSGEVVRANARLEAAQSELERQVKERTEQLERTLAHQLVLAKRMVKIRDEERARLAADLHDGVAQDVTSLAVSLDLMRIERRGKSPQWLEDRLDEGLLIARRAGKSLREVIGGLRKPGLEGVPLITALHQHAREFEARTGILVNVDSVPSRDTLPLKVKEALLRICLEALANVAKHADANTVRVTLKVDVREARLIVDDDGCGFNLEQASRRDGQSGSGLEIMRERAISMGGELRLQSVPGAGTRVVCAIALGPR